MSTEMWIGVAAGGTVLVGDAAPVDGTAPVGNGTAPVGNGTAPVGNGTAPVGDAAPVGNGTAPVGDAAPVLRITRREIAAAGVSEADFVAAVAPLLSREALSFPWKRLYVADPAVMMARLRAHRATPSREPVAPHNVRFHAVAEPIVAEPIVAEPIVAGRAPLFPLLYNYGGGDRSGGDRGGGDRGGWAPLCWLHSPEDYAEMDVFSDVYTERARLSARRQDTALSPLEQWRDPEFVRRIVEGALAAYGRADPESLRETFYGAVKEATQFKPSLAAAVMRHFGARRVLDMSAGWGDRLAGAIAAGVERYTAFDPNTALREGHLAMVRDHVPAAERGRFEVTYVPFEQAALEPGAYDLFFSSPPFFDFEVYTAEPGQSIDRYAGYEAWLVDFLFASLIRAWAALAAGGHLAVHITDVYKTRVCEPMCLFLQGYAPGAEYLGVMCSRGLADRPRPIWCFAKRGAAQGAAAQGAAAQGAAAQAASRVRAARKELARLFPAIAARVRKTGLESERR